MSNPPPIVPMSSPDLTDAEREAVNAVLATPMLSMGPRIDAFEAAMRAFTGAKHAVAVNSGTAGLHLCVRAAGIQASDRVITSPFSFVASTNVLLYENAVPIFVDVDPLTGNIDPRLVREAAADLAQGGAAAQRWLPRKGTEGGPLKGVLAVDVFGQPADMDALREITNAHSLALIEDSCEALGAEYKHRPAGMLGDMGVFAFYPNKQITTGEGGLIVTNDDRAAHMMRALRNQGRAPGDTWLQHTYLGYNYRMDEMSAALGEVQIGRLPGLLAAREQVANWYQDRLSAIRGLEAPQIAPETSRVSWFVYVIRLQNGAERDRVAAQLAQKGVPVRPYFVPIHLQPYLVERFGYQPGDFPVTEDLGARGLALPFSGKMSQEQVELVCSAIQSVV